MGIISWLGGGDVTAVKTAAKKGAIEYDAGLIERLKRDHQGLVKAFSEIVTAVDSRQYKEVSRLLGRFKIALQAHVMTENVKFYVYMQNKVNSDPDTSKFVTDLRSEMDSIAHAVVKFANYHTTNVLTDETAGAFVQQLREIGETLLQRVELEETRLYTLYSE